MNTIKIYLTESGRVADLSKDFPLFKGQFNDKLLNVYVPTSLLAPQFSIQHYIGQMRLDSIPQDTDELNALFSTFVANMMPPLEDGTQRSPMEGDVIEVYDISNDKYYLYVCSITENVVTWTPTEVNSFGTFSNIAGTSIKLGLIATKRNGTIYESKSYFMRFLKTLVYDGKEYALYERKLPKEFTSFVGTSTIIANVVNVDTESKEVISLITSQTCDLEVFQSNMLDQDETIPVTTATEFDARISELESKVQSKQDKVDANISTNSVVTTQNLVGAVNQTSSQVVTNVAQIQQNVQDIAQNAQDIQEIREVVSVGENPVGDLTVDTLDDIEEELDALVYEVEEREPLAGDVIMVTLQITGQTDEIYKYYYTASGWKNYKMPAIESASNTDKGIIKGTLGGNKNTQVDITGGEINAIYVKDNSNALRDIREYANTTKTSLDNIISGSTKAGHSVRADQDQNGNEITNTYLTQNAGVTKTQMREYAMPREFNDIYFLGKDGADTIISNEKPSSSLTWSESVSGIGTTELLSATFISNASFELSQKNSYQAVFYASADVNKTCQFRADIKYDNVVISTELSNEFVMVANNVYKVQFNANFNELQDVINYDGTKQLEIVLSVVTTDSGTATFTLYTNNNYISTFNLNTNKYTIATQSGYLGEIVEINSTGTLANGVVTFEIDRTIYNNTLIKFVLSYTGGSTTDEIVVVDADTNEEYHLKTPYNTDAFADRPVVEDFRQTSISITGGVTTISFVGLSKVIENYGTEIFVNEDNLTEIFTLISSKQNALTQTQLDAVNSGIDSTKVAQISTNATDITNLSGRVGTAETNITNLQNGKVDKTNTTSKVYATDSSGNQTTIDYSTTADANKMVKRIPTGDIDVPVTPAYANSAASKQYVDKVTQYDPLYQGANTSGTFTISNITNYKYLILAFKYITTENLHAWDTSIVPADYVASELAANRPFALHAGDNAGSNIRSVIINFLSNTSISIGYASNLTWCILWGVGK